ncbi:MAG: septum formation initiator family protein [Nitrospirota bacterium]
MKTVRLHNKTSRTSGWVSRFFSKKRLFIAAGICLGLYLVVSFILGEMGLVKYYRMKMQHASLVEDIDRLKRDNFKLRKDVQSLKHDGAMVERIARDKLGLARPGEIVYYYGEQ